MTSEDPRRAKIAEAVEGYNGWLLVILYVNMEAGSALTVDPGDLSDIVSALPDAVSLIEELTAKLDIADRFSVRSDIANAYKVRVDELTAEVERLKAMLGKAHYCQICGKALEEYDGD